MKGYSKLPHELTFAIEKMDWFVGQTRRIIHEKCSRGKDAALSIVRKPDGFWFFCFRCAGTNEPFQGFLGDKEKSPEEVLLMIDNMKKEKEFEVMDVAQLPEDMVPILQERSKIIPWAAYRWFWDRMVMPDIPDKYGAGWSPSYNRVIVPIYEYGSSGKTGSVLCKKLIGWIGRDVHDLTKEERKGTGCAKYITKKSSEYQHIFFHAPAINSENYVIVEDVLSAMRIREALGYNAIALLTTYMPTRLMLKLRKKKITLWLDGDMTAVTMNYLTKMQQFGIDCKYVITTKDPKDYNDMALRQCIRRRKHEAV